MSKVKSEERKVQIDAYCVSDSRSVAAMLRGTGDGREKLYDMYARKARLRKPEVTDEELALMYEHDAKDYGLVNRLKAMVAIGRVGYHAIGVCAVFVMLKYLFG